MNNSTHADLLKILDDVAIVSSTSFSLGPESVIEVESQLAITQVTANPFTTNPLVDRLAAELYARYYCRSIERPCRVSLNSPVADPKFVQQLSNANASQDRWDSGWSIYQVDPAGGIQVHKSGRTRTVNPHEYAIAKRPSPTPQINDIVCLKISREIDRQQAGFYHVGGDNLPDQFDEFDRIRVYFHIAPDGAPLLVSHLTSTLNRHLVPFRLKCMTDPTHYDRLDACVLYVIRRYFGIMARVIASLPVALTLHFRPKVPLFSKPLRIGVGLAEDPQNGESFGQNRCRLLAEGIHDAWNQGCDNIEARFAAVQMRFANDGLSLERPYLNSGSIDQFELPAASFRIRYRNDDSPFLATADRIGQRICRDAQWAGNRCNWMGWWIDANHGVSPAVYRACQNGLAEGTAGIALFLSQLYRLTNDSLQQSTLAGAIQQVISAVSQSNSSIELGRDAGLPGIAYSLIECGSVLDDEDIVNCGLRELSRLREINLHEASIELLTELASTIPILIDVSQRFANDELIRIAIAHGEHLVFRAHETDDGWTWNDEAHSSQHSASAIVNDAQIIRALGELSHATGNANFRDAALAGMRFQRKHTRHWLKIRRMGLPARRCMEEKTGQETHPTTQISSFETEHRAVSRAKPNVTPMDDADVAEFSRDGADNEGVTLKTCVLRLQSLRLLDQQEDMVDAVEQVEAIATSFVDLVRTETEDFSLFSGVTGKGDLLLLTAELAKRQAFVEAARSGGLEAIDRFDRSGLPWPSGNSDHEEHLTLASGLAGIGYFYLRLHDSSKVPAAIIHLRQSQFDSATDV